MSRDPEAPPEGFLNFVDKGRSLVDWRPRRKMAAVSSAEAAHVAATRGSLCLRFGGDGSGNGRVNVELPESFCRVAPLVFRLTFSGSCLEVFRPSYLPMCTRLRDLVLSVNWLREVPTVLRQMKSLVGLHMNFNHIRAVPAWLVELNKLEVIGLSHNCVRELPIALRKLAVPRNGRLRQLFLDANPCTAGWGRTTSWYDELEAEAVTVRARMVAFVSVVVGSHAGAVGTFPMFDRNLIRFIFGFLTSSVYFLDRPEEEQGPEEREGYGMQAGSELLCDFAKTARESRR